MLHYASRYQLNKPFDIKWHFQVILRHFLEQQMVCFGLAPQDMRRCSKNLDKFALPNVSCFQLRDILNKREINSHENCVECTASLIIIFIKNIFCVFRVNQTVLFLNLLELFFSDHWIRFYRIRKAASQKKYFSDKSFLAQFFQCFFAFMYLCL